MIRTFTLFFSVSGVFTDTGPKDGHGKAEK
jgi:hypothetical protein